MAIKILTILGTRPEIIRLSRIMPKLDRLCDHRVLHTGQNYDATLSDIFFRDLELRQPDCVLDSRGTLAQQLAGVFQGVENYVNEFKPDRVLILGDTNSGLAAIICERLGIPVYHMEAGNRCYDLRVPEEKNRRLIDAVSSVNLPYTSLSRENLLREGIPNNRILVTGNPIKEVLCYYQDKINQSDVLSRLGVQDQDYVVATAHRAENVDDHDRLMSIMSALAEIAQDQPVIFSCHPRTRQRLADIKISTRVTVCEPLGFFDFVRLEQSSHVGITDSGTVQEELCLFGVPTVTIRETTERPETVWCGSNVVSGLDRQRIIDSYHHIKSIARTWPVPVEYDRDNVSDVVCNILMGNNV